MKEIWKSSDGSKLTAEYSKETGKYELYFRGKHCSDYQDDFEKLELLIEEMFNTNNTLKDWIEAVYDGQ